MTALRTLFAECTGAGTLRAEHYRLCHDQQLSGSHVTELKRTAITLAHKRGKSEAEVFPEAVAIVTRHFGVQAKKVGFNASE